jgi:basic membrane protein A
MMKPSYVVAILLIGATVIHACAPATPNCTKPEVFCVGMLTDNGTVADKSVNQAAWEALQQSEKDGVADWVQYIETTDAGVTATNIPTLGDAGYDVIVTLGSAMTESTHTAAAAYPNTYFIGVDQYQDATISNVAGLTFPEDQAGFLVGALAAMMSQTRKIGAICSSSESPIIWRYCEGVRSGAGFIDPDVQVFVEYHDDVSMDMAFTDPEWGVATADSMIDRGADVIFGAGGTTGTSAVTEAALRGAYAIGADSDQYFILPEAAPGLLSSAVKLITPGVAELIVAAKTAQGSGAAFPAGNFMGKVAYAPFHDLDPMVSGDIKVRLEEINTGLLNGTIWTNVSPFNNSNP